MKERAAYALLLNAFVVFSEAFAFTTALRTRGFSVFTYYTEVANALAFLASLILCATVLVLRGRIPPWVRILRYLSVVMLLLVVFVVLLVLSPLLGGLAGAKILFFDGTMFYFHLLCPALSVLSFFLFEGGTPLLQHHALVALLPTVFYASALLILNALSVVSGPYPFFMIYDMPPLAILFLAALILAAAFLLATLTRRLDRWIGAYQAKRGRADKGYTEKEI